MLPNDLYAVSQCEPLVWMGRNRSIQRGMSDRNARSRRDNPPNVLVMAIPKFNPKR